jgi:DNA-directed RNA polymerase specialized sigma24 family protein
LPGSTIDFAGSIDEERYGERARTAFAGEPELAEVVRAVLELNLYKPREIAAELGITAAEVQNRKKRLQRQLIDHNLVGRKTA